MIKDLREKSGVTQKALSDRLGFTTAQFISNVECGRCTLPVKYFKRTAKMLRVPVGVLIKRAVELEGVKLKRAFKTK